MLGRLLRGLLEESARWCHRKQWWWRLPLLAWFSFIFVRHLMDPLYASILSPLTLGLHELGHLVFLPFGEFAHMAGGSLFQILAPVFSIYNFYRQRDFFSIALSWGWLSDSLFDMARYARDARAMELDLVTPFGESAVHDWNYLLGKTGLLEFDLAIASSITAAAVAAALVCILYGSWLLYQMTRQDPAH